MRAPSGQTADEAHASGADLSGAEDQPEASGTQDLPLPSQGPRHHPPRSGQVAPTSAPSPCAGGFLTGWRSWTGTAARCSAGGCRTPWMRTVLRRGPEGGAGQIRAARDLQLRSGSATHQHRVHPDVAGRQGEDLHGWAWPLDRQPDDRKAVAVAERRMRLPERLRDRVRGPRGHRRPDQLLQQRTSALIAWIADARGSPVIPPPRTWKPPTDMKPMPELGKALNRSKIPENLST